MSARKIAIAITVENRQAIINTQTQTTATNQLNQATQGLTHVQAGLTNSFIKGNLAARAISVAYISLRNAVQDMVTTGIEFQFTMAKIHAISGEGTESVKSLETTIRSMAQSSMKSAPEIAKVANEMGKLGLTNKQVEALIGSVTTLGVALDEDLVVAGETVVKVLNTYGMSVSQGKKISEQLAFTVAASALDLEKFGTAFSYVGGTAAVAGVKFEDLAGAMDFLSNAGIKSSTIGTQLRRIIADLANENSKAGKAIGGTATSVGGLIPALKKLDEVLPKDQDKRISVLTDMFGRTATSVAALMIRNADAIEGFSKRTTEATGNLDRMKGIMDNTFAAAIERHKNAWRELGLVIGEVVGPATKVALNYFTSYMNALTSGQVALYKLPQQQIFKPKAMGMGDLKTMDEEALKAELDAFTKMQGAMADAAAEASATDLKEQLEELKATFDSLQSTMEIEKLLGQEIAYDKYIAKYEALANSFRKLGAAKEAAQALRELRQIEEELFEEQSLGSGDDLRGGSRLLDFQNAVAPMSWEGVRSQVELTGSDTEKDKKKEKAFNEMQESILRNKPNQSRNDKLELLDLELNQELSRYEKHEIDVTELKKAHEDQRKAYKSKLMAEEVGMYFALAGGVTGAYAQMFSTLARENKKYAGIAKTLAIAEVIMNTAVAVSKVWGQTGIYGIFAQAAPIASGIAQIATINAQKFASGTDQVVNRPTLFMAGEAGRERVQVTPRAKMSGGGDGPQIVVNIQGDVYGADKFNEAVAVANSRLSRSMV